MNSVDSLVKAVVPYGYQGKILLVRIRKDDKQVVILRSGDLWHSAILRNLEAEIRSIGWEDAEIEELGGAHLSFQPDDSISIWGTSDIYGACDKEFAAELVRTLWLDKKINVSD